MYPGQFVRRGVTLSNCHVSVSHTRRARESHVAGELALSARRPETVLALTDYGGPITAVVGRDNLAGTQFHPEKSQSTGLRLIANFLRWKP